MTRKPTYEELEQRVRKLEKEASERKLLENELILKSIVFDMSIAANSTADKEGVINYVNLTFLKMWGYETKEEATGNPVPHFFQNPDDAIPVLEALNKSGFWRGEFKAKRKDGSIFISRGLASVVRDEAGHQIGYYSANIDITEQKQAEDKIKELNATLEQRVVERTIELEATNKQLKAEITERKQAEETLKESEERYRTLFEGAAEGLLVADIETKQFKYANPAMCRMLGYTEKEIGRLSILDIHPKEDMERVTSEFEAIGKGETELAQGIPFLRKDGTLMYAEHQSNQYVDRWKKMQRRFLHRHHPAQAGRGGVAAERRTASSIIKDLACGDIHHRSRRKDRVLE
ncbi:MAG: PAS domain S-box protein [Deltaproteobacteria bacterium]|nr:PAS domain S-box protein [Deltaproteobacteria bacterium]